MYPSASCAILVDEMASDENGGDKAAWIASIVPTLKTDFPEHGAPIR